MRRFAAIAFLALVLVPGAAAAAKTPVFGLRAIGNPKLGYFVYSLAPGATRRGGIIVSNSGTATGTVKLFAADGTTGRTSGTVYQTDSKPNSTGAWISLSKTSLTLKPGEHRRVGFAVRVPAGASTGQWVAGIVAETSRQLTAPKSKRKASVQIRIRDLTIVAVQVNVPGTPVSAFRVGAVTTGGQRGFQQVIAHMENNGNILVKPTGSITVFDSKGARLQTLPFAMDTFLPRTAIDYPLLLKKALAPGTYSVAVRVSIPATSGARAVSVNERRPLVVSKIDVQQVFTSAAPQTPPPGTSSSGSASKTPWALIAGAVAGGLIVVALIAWLLARRRRHGTVIAPTTAQGPVPVPAPAPASDEAPPALAPVSERTAPPPAAPAPILPPLPPEPPSDPAVEPEPVSEPAVAPGPPPAAAPAPERPPQCVPYHFWEVAYDRGELGGDGVWRFPHRCRNCGLELLARDVDDATAQADARPSP